MTSKLAAGRVHHYGILLAKASQAAKVHLWGSGEFAKIINL